MSIRVIVIVFSVVLVMICVGFTYGFADYGYRLP